METILELVTLNKTFPGSIHAVQDLNLTIAKQDIFALLGPNGAGKTTTLRMICGLCRPTSGEIRFNRELIGKHARQTNRQIGLVSQHFNIDPDLTGYENLKIHAYLYGITGSTMKKKCIELLDFAGLGTSKDRIVRTYSGGMKRKLQIIRALLHDPVILFLDEPTVGLDPVSREMIWNLLKTLNREGKTVLLCTHYIEEAQNYANQVAIMHKGTIITKDSPDNLIQKLGPWCCETFSDNKTVRSYYPDKERAEKTVKQSYQQLTIRPTQLEDVFINVTGEKELL